MLLGLVTDRRRGVRTVRFAPYFSGYSLPKHKPPRKIHWSGSNTQSEGEVVELSAVNSSENIAWFERTYADELKALAEAYGVPVQVGNTDGKFVEVIQA